MRNRHHALDLLRGLAALGIAIYHFLAGHGVLVQSLGTFGVYVFFVLSALTMMMVYERRFGGGLLPAAVLDFYRNRAARVLPLLAVVAIASALIAAKYGVDAGTFGKALLTGSGFLALGPPGLISNTSGAWSLGIEIGFYIVAPIAIMLASQAKIKTLVWSTIALIVVQQLYFTLIQDRTGKDHWNFYTSPITYAPFFMMGFVVYKAHAPSGFIWPLVATTAIAVLVSFSIFIPADIFHSPLVYLGLSGVAFAAVYSTFQLNLPSRFNWIAGFLGDVSYALYLTHPITLLFVESAAKRLGFGPAVQMTIFVPAALFVSWVVFRNFERPARDRFRSASAPRPDAPALG